MQQKNFIVAILLSVGFMLFWTYFVMPRFTPPAPPAPVTSTTSAAAGTDISNAAAPSVLPAGAGDILPEASLEDNNNDIVLSANGGSVKSWKLKLKGKSVELVEHPEIAPLPLATFPNVLFKINRTKDAAVMVGTLANGLTLTKTLRLDPTGNMNTISLRFQNPTAQPIELKNWQWGWGPGVGTAESEQKENARLVRVITLGPLKVHVIKEGDQQEFGHWAAIDNRYFLIAFIPDQASKPQIAVTGKKDLTDFKLVETTMVPAHGEAVVGYHLYIGPKGYTHLKTYGQRLEEAVDFGTFSFFGRLILAAIYRLQKVTGNYGWAIILLTVCLQILFSPLTIKSFKAAQAMKKLQPQLAALQARYRNDQKRLSVETMNLYKKSGTNPFGGCLPMVAQLPIFWALFTALRNAYELRGAPFIGWIHDLSVADPYRILPIIMGGAMFLQQRMSAAVTDPTQKQMMYMMPIIFTFMFMNFPAGLVLYWLTNNLVTMAFQYSYLRATRETPGTPDRPQVIS